MSASETLTLAQHCRELSEAAKRASSQMAGLDSATKNRWLEASAKSLVRSEAAILQANARDLSAAAENGLTQAQMDRLRLDPDRLQVIAEGMRQVASLPDPCGEIIEGHVRPNGLRIEKVRVPLGVVFFIYESRPNVTADAAAICVKSGNAVILRGGKEAAHSSRAIVQVLQEESHGVGLPPAAVQLVDVADREAVGHFLQLNEFIDVAIPRGGEGLIRRVVAEATMPVIKHFDGNCHVYIDAAADLEMAVTITENAKCQRMGVCNACESLLIHETIAEVCLPVLADRLRLRGVELRGDSRASQIVSMTTATEEDFGTEYLAPIISVAVVRNIDEAIAHINRYGSHHTDAIVTNDINAADQFTQLVDSSAVMVNASTRFNDGGEFGLGAEIGISTDKFHARGPCGLRELTSYKYIVRGAGHIR